jgi:thiol-disulfide isomerase/thioredoxin
MSAVAGRRRLLVVGGVLAAVAGAGWNWWRHRRAGSRPAVGEAMWSLSFERPDGGTLDMAGLRGRPLLINFWATWCPPCVKEMPQLDRFSATQGGRLRVIGLAIDGAAPVREFLARQPVHFDIGLAGMDGTTLAHDLGNTGGALPFTALIDADGVIVRHKAGETNAAELVGWLESL